MRSISIVVLALLPFLVHAQVAKFHVFVSPSYTFAGNQTKQANTILLNPQVGSSIIDSGTGTLQEKYQGRIGFDLGALVEKTLTEKFFVKSGISFSLKRFKRTDVVNYSNETFENTYPVINGSPIGSMYGAVITRDASGRLLITNNNQSLTFQSNEKNADKVGETNAFYLQIPLAFGYRAGEKFTMEGGALFSTLLAASTFEKSYTLFQNQLIQDQGHWNNSTHGLTPYLLNLNTKVSYKVNRYISVHTEYQRSLSAIYEKDKQVAGKAKFNTTYLGVSYALRSKN